MARKKLYDDLPERNHPEYMKLYAEKHKEKIKERSKEYREKKIQDNPNFYKDHYKTYEETSKKWRQQNKNLICEKQWLTRGIIDLDYQKFTTQLKLQKNLKDPLQ